MSSKTLKSENEDAVEIRNRKASTTTSKINEAKDQVPEIDNLTNESKISQRSTTMVQDLCEQLRTEIVQELKENLKISLDSAVGRIVEKSESINLMQSSNWLKENMSDKHYTSTSTDIWLPEKKFIHRNSVLTDLFKISHIETVYHIFVAILLIFCVNTILSDVVEKGGLVHIYHLELFLWVFKGIRAVFNCWLVMFTCTSLCVYLTFVFWATRRQSGSDVTNFDKFFLCLYVAYQIAFIILPAAFICMHDIAPATTLIVSLEQARMLMKSHAFVRTNAEKAFILPENVKVGLSHHHRKSHADERFPSVLLGDGIPSTFDEELSMSNGFGLPPFSNYLFFLFAPTLVYKSSYPRTPYVRWRVVVFNLVQVGLCIIYTYFIFTRFCFSHFDKFGRSKQFTFSMRQLVISSFGCMLPGALVLLISFYAFLHCWLNAFAEMLRFGDRLFYKDWWNSVTFSAYYRGWNVVVHDWLYTYVYRDVYAICKKKRRILAQTAVFLLSAVVHEYILTVVFRFFYPVLFVIFGGVGFGIGHLKGCSRLWNIGIWASLFSGMGILMCLYSMEWYARKNCPPIDGHPILDMFVPRSWFCRQEL